MKKNSQLLSLSALVSFFPAIVLAAPGDLIANINNKIINPLIGLLFTVALAYFVYGVFELFIAGKNGSASTQGVNHVKYGVLGFAIMVSAFGIIRFICGSLGATC